jgi:hypothetical protein
MTQDALDLVDDESAFALRDPEEAPSWLVGASKDLPGLIVIGVVFAIVIWS